MASHSAAVDAGDFVIRAATNGDLPAVHAVLAAVRAEFGVVDESGVSDRDLDDLEANYLRRGGVFEVVVDRNSGRIVGCMGLLPLSPCRVELCKMYILSSARGKGLGKRLVENALAAARRNGFAEVWLETNSALATATALYERYGFRPVAAEQLLPRCDAAYLLKLT